MRKYAFLIIGILFVLLVACGVSDSVENDSENDGIQDELLANEHETSDDDAEEIDLEKKLGLKTEDIFSAELFNGKEETLQSYDYENTKIDIVDSDPFRMFVYYVNGAEYASSIVLKNNGNNKELSRETFDFFYNKMDEVVQNSSRKFERAVDDYYLLGVIFNKEIDIDNPPVDLSEISGADFFLDDDNVDFYKTALNKAKYKGLYDRVTSYINDNEISEYDSANAIIEILEPIQDYMDDIEIDYDDFDDVSTIYYEGLNDVNNENYIVPFTTTNDNTMNFLIGFEKSDWLFADNVVFNIDGERENFGTYDFDTEVLDGGTIREVATKTNYSDDTLEKILESDDVRMRFEGDKGQLDYTLTDNDLKAIKTIHSFGGISNKLSNLLSRFEKN